MMGDMTRKPGLSLERHKQLGPELAEIQAYLARLQCEVGNAYPRTTKALRDLKRAEDALEVARRAMENLMFDIDPEMPAEANRIYFP